MPSIYLERSRVCIVVRSTYMYWDIVGNTEPNRRIWPSKRGSLSREDFYARPLCKYISNGRNSKTLHQELRLLKRYGLPKFMSVPVCKHSVYNMHPTRVHSGSLSARRNHWATIRGVPRWESRRRFQCLRILKEQKPNMILEGLVSINTDIARLTRHAKFGESC